MSKNYKDQVPEEAKVEKKATAIVMADRLNLRQAPSTDSKALYILSKGEILQILEDRIDWQKVRYERLALEGYVMTEFIRVE